MTMINASDANFYYEIHGTGNPVVLISGYTCDYSHWEIILPELSKHYQVLVFDNRGVGRTTDNNLPLSAKLMAQDVIAITEKLNLERPHIIGHSMGGTIAQTIASLYPEKIDKLCILSSSSKWRQAMLRALKALLDMWENNIEFDLIFETTLPWIFGESFLRNEKNIIELKKAILENPYPQSLSNQIRQFKVLETFDSTTQLKNIKAPSLVIYGAQDLLTLPKESQYIASQIPRAKLVEFDCGHDLLHELPQPLTDTLLSFLKETRS